MGKGSVDQSSDFLPVEVPDRTALLVTLEAYQQAADQLLKRAERLALEALDAKECAVALLDRCSALVAETLEEESIHW